MIVIFFVKGIGAPAMRDYCRLKSTFWTGHTGKQIRGNGTHCQLLALYLISSPGSNMNGLYYLPLSTISHDTGLSKSSVTKEIKFLDEIGFSKYDDENEVVWVIEMARYQTNDGFKVSDNQCKGVLHQLKSYANCKFYKEFMAKYAEPFNLNRDLSSSTQKSHSNGSAIPSECHSRALGMPSEARSSFHEQLSK